MGTAEVMADRRGGLVATEDVGDFADKVRRLFDDPALHARLRAQASAKPPAGVSGDHGTPARSLWKLHSGTRRSSPRRHRVCVIVLVPPVREGT